MDKTTNSGWMLTWQHTQIDDITSVLITLVRMDKCPNLASLLGSLVIF
jgi:hypothetical protein